jgi:hypothetical protein
MASWIVFAATVALAPKMATAQVKPAVIQQRDCSQQVIDSLEVESGHIRRWSKLQHFYHRYAACGVEDAEVETGVAEAVSRMLIHDWGSLSTANHLFLSHPEFKNFALGALNITDATDDLNRIDKLAANHCKPDLQSLCRDIRNAIRDNK